MADPQGHHAGTQGAESSSSDLIRALDACQVAAREGYDLAHTRLSEATRHIDELDQTLLRTMRQIESSDINTEQVLEHLRDQYKEIASHLRKEHLEADEKLNTRWRELERFSITLFGRTMAGKSTLMEILTRGDGSRIGLGAQRTTRDVRSYEWRGLQVTDVPGVAAFEGEEDEALALQSAERADLVLFLITDDAPQPVEAEWLAKVRRLGKPVVGLCNVKCSLEDEDDLLMFLDDHERHFSSARLDALFNQLHTFAARHGIGDPVPFTPVHLRAQFLAEQPKYIQFREGLVEGSRFGRVERLIVDEVVGRGRFLRAKSFIDGADTYLERSSRRLFIFSEQSHLQARIFSRKAAQVQDWLKGFRVSGHDRIHTFVAQRMEELRDAIPGFTEAYYADKQAGEKWGEIISQMGLQKHAERLLEGFVEEFKLAVSEISREMQEELGALGALVDDVDISMDSVFDSKRVMNWSVTLLSAGLGLAAMLFAMSPLGWAAAGVGLAGAILGFFMDDREEKVRQRREVLAKRLEEHVGELQERFTQGLITWFDMQIVVHGELIIGNLAGLAMGLRGLYHAQLGLACALNKEHKQLSATLWCEALKQLGCDEAAARPPEDVARVPGFAMAVVLDSEAHPLVDGELLKRAEQLLGERIVLCPKNARLIPLLSHLTHGLDCVSASSLAEPDATKDPIRRERDALVQQLMERPFPRMSP